MKCIYIYNPKSGRQRNTKIKDLVVKTLKTKFDFVDAFSTKQRGDAGSLAKSACGKYDVLVVSGGDGTVNEVINAIANEENRPQIGYIPTGTVNDLAHSIGIPINVKKALKIILDGHTIEHDIFKINDKYGIYISGFGLFTALSYTTDQTSKKILGKLAYYLYGIKEIGSAQKTPTIITTDMIKIEEDIILGLIVNSKYVGGYKIDKMADCSNGYVNVILFKESKKKGISLKMFFNIVRLMFFGINVLKNSKNCIIMKLNKFSVTIPENTAVNIDGEKGLHGSFDFEILNKHVQIFVKEKQNNKNNKNNKTN